MTTPMPVRWRRDWAYNPVPAPQLQFFTQFIGNLFRRAERTGDGHRANSGKLCDIRERDFSGTAPFSG
jgi:hypothetical protein